jgi:predicted transcriptional regulator
MKLNKEPHQELMKAVEEVRKEKGLKSWEFAAKMGIGPSHYSHLVSGNRKPSRKNLSNIIRTFPELRGAVACYWQRLGDAILETA